MKPYPRDLRKDPWYTRVADSVLDNMAISIAALFAVIIALGITGIAVVRHSGKHVTFTVSDKAIMSTGDNNNGHKYMIYSSDGNVYEDTDSLAFMKFNSSNVYAQLVTGHTYDCLVSGWRVPVLSVQNNIIHCAEVSK